MDEIPTGEIVQNETARIPVDIDIVPSVFFKDRLIGCLKDGENTPAADPLNDKKDGILSTSADNPKVVYENGAIPCAILIALNDKGDVSLVHEPMTGNVNSTGQLSEIDNSILNILDATAIGYGNGAKVILTGINVHEGTRQPTVAAIEDKLPSYRGRVERYLTDNSGTEKQADQIFGVTPVVYDGVCVIPPQLSVDGHTKVMIISRKFTEAPVSPAEVLVPKPQTSKGFGFSLE